MVSYMGLYQCLWPMNMSMIFWYFLVFLVKGPEEENHICFAGFLPTIRGLLKLSWFSLAISHLGWLNHLIQFVWTFDEGKTAFYPLARNEEMCPYLIMTISWPTHFHPLNPQMFDGQNPWSNPIFPKIPYIKIRKKKKAPWWFLPRIILFHG